MKDIEIQNLENRLRNGEKIKIKTGFGYGTIEYGFCPMKTEKNKTFYELCFFIEIRIQGFIFPAKTLKELTKLISLYDI